MIKLAVKELQSAKFYAIFLVLVVVIGIFGLSPAISLLMNNVVIGSTGRIATAAPMTYKSEIRGVVMHEAIFGVAHDWNVIAETLSQYKINSVYANFIGHATGIRPDAEWIAAINAFHSQGIEFHAIMNVLGDTASSPDTAALSSAGQPTNWNCPIKVRDLVRSTIEQVVSTYDIDGLMLDYIRYAEVDMCYCPECKAVFEQWLGEGTITDWTPFYPNQPRWKEYAEWRTVPVTELVRDIRTWALAIKPDLKISLAAFTYLTDCPTYWRKWIGQDTGNWIKNGYIDLVSPMMYTKTILGSTGETLQSFIDADLKYMTDGPEGKIPLIANLRSDWSDADLTPEELKAQIDYVRSRGLDGWLIWRYGGPGSAEPNPDIREYLSIIDMPSVFTLGNMSVSTLENQATITWKTSLPATSKVEYSVSPLFNASWELWRSDFYYWGMSHINGTVVEESTLAIDHNITLTGLLPETKYYFRVQSQDPSGIATSRVLNFTTAGGI